MSAGCGSGFRHVVTLLAPGLRCLLAPNPSPMTGPGTNCYLLGHGPYAVVDPGVADEAHLSRLLAATDHDIAAILLTHRHPDHAEAAQALAAATGALIHAWPKPRFGAHDVPVVADQGLTDGQRLDVGGLRLVVHHAPGHAADHVVFELADSGWLLAGDTLMADVTVVILPPDGDMSAYLESLARLSRLAKTHIAPGHGQVLTDPAGEIAAVIVHRERREAQVRDCLLPAQPRSATEIVATLYPALDRCLAPVAAAQVEAHLIRLAGLGQAEQAATGWIRPRPRSCPKT